LSVAFEHPKSSSPPAQAAPLSAGKAIAAAKILLKTQLFIFALRSFDPAGAAERSIELSSMKARYEPGIKSYKLR
jgi:hypothetical protein